MSLFDQSTMAGCIVPLGAKSVALHKCIMQLQISVTCNRLAAAIKNSASQYTNPTPPWPPTQHLVAEVIFLHKDHALRCGGINKHCSSCMCACASSNTSNHPASQWASMGAVKLCQLSICHCTTCPAPTEHLAMPADVTPHPRLSVPVMLCCT